MKCTSNTIVHLPFPPVEFPPSFFIFFFISSGIPHTSVPVSTSEGFGLGRSPHPLGSHWRASMASSRSTTQLCFFGGGLTGYRSADLLEVETVRWFSYLFLGLADLWKLVPLLLVDERDPLFPPFQLELLPALLTDDELPILLREI